MRPVDAGVMFGCSQCNRDIRVHSAIIEDDGKMYLLGPCHDCKAMCKLDIQLVVVALSEKHKLKGN